MASQPVLRSRKPDALLMSWSAWMADRRTRPLRQATRYVYLARLRNLLSIAEDKGHALITGDIKAVRVVLGHLSPHPSTQAGYMNALRSFYDFLREQGIRRDNPARDVGRPPQLRGQPRPMSSDDARRYLEAAQRIDVRHHAIATLGLFMGLRRDEIRTRRWADFFAADGRRWCDIEGKGGRRRRESVHREAAIAISRLRDSHTDATWLFPSPVRARAGQPASTPWMANAHHRILETAGLEGKGYTLHTLRHTFATQMRATGSDVATVQRALGHASPETTMIYMDILPSEVANAIDRVSYGVDSQ